MTVAEFREFDPGYKLTDRQASSPDCPAVNVSWYQAALYCNWLSKQEDIKPDQWCYQPDGDGKIARMNDKFLSLSGYRLPTEAEMEYATRANHDESLLRRNRAAVAEIRLVFQELGNAHLARGAIEAE